MFVPVESNLRAINIFHDHLLGILGMPEKFSINAWQIL